MRALGSAARAFIALNVRLSRALERRFGLASDKPFWVEFEQSAARLVRALPDGATVVDVGGGRRCVYASAVPPGRDVRLVAVDVSAEELALNTDVAEKHVADVSQGLPFPDASVDLVLSRTVLEHVPDVGAAVGHMARVLRPGGVALSFLPGRYSLFAIAARLLPFGPALRFIHWALPASRGQIEFEVHYDRCHPQALERTFREAGFRHVAVSQCWAQQGYFEWFLPLYLAHAAYEWVVRSLNARRLAAYMIVRAER